jgi:DNA polymerase-3 subunit epsilon
MAKAKTLSYLDELQGKGRVIFLDTETTGFNPENDKIVEVGAIEIIDGKEGEHFHVYINPERSIPSDATEVHGITDDQVEHERKFYQVAQDLLSFIDGAKVVMHNASFDVGFLDAELKVASRRVNEDLKTMSEHCEVIDSLAIARKLRPGSKNDLDSLCKALKVDNSNRDLHGALIDAKILSDVYGGLINYEREHHVAQTEKPYDDELVVKPVKVAKRPRVVSSLSM